MNDFIKGGSIPLADYFRNKLTPLITNKIKENTMPEFGLEGLLSMIVDAITHCEYRFYYAGKLIAETDLKPDANSMIEIDSITYQVTQITPVVDLEKNYLYTRISLFKP